MTALPRPLIALTAVFLFLLVAAPASAAVCGDTITEDTTLTSDVLGCEGTALVVTGDGVDLDLAGHKVQGVLVLNEATGPVIHGGTIEGGIAARFATGAVIRDNVITKEAPASSSAADPMGRSSAT